MDVDCSGFIEFAEFCTIMHNKLKDTDLENELKETFRVFSKDNEGVCLWLAPLHWAGLFNSGCRVESESDMRFRPSTIHPDWLLCS